MPKFGIKLKTMLSKSDKALHEKILKGTRLAVERLIEESKKNDDYLVFSEKGKIVKVKARKLKRKV
jgi:hypothetical protein